MHPTSTFNPYVVLGVPANASDDEIRAAAARRMAEDPDALVRIEHAQRVLKNPEARRQLDEMLERRLWGFFDEPSPPPPKKQPSRRRFGFPLPKLVLAHALLSAAALLRYLEAVS